MLPSFEFHSGNQSREDDQERRVDEVALKLVPWETRGSGSGDTQVGGRRRRCEASILRRLRIHPTQSA